MWVIAHLLPFCQVVSNCLGKYVSLGEYLQIYMTINSYTFILHMCTYIRTYIYIFVCIFIRSFDHNSIYFSSPAIVFVS